MSRADIPLPQPRGFAQTARRDAWWVQPLLTVLALGGFIVYANWAAFQAKEYFFHGGGSHYLSPFYSPLLFGQEGEPRWIDAVQPSWWPGWFPFSPALLILAGPAIMRATCYYYRGAYYKGFFADPLNCAVGEPGIRGKRYGGENRFPLIMQNIHRYVFYPAAGFVMVLCYDAWRAMWFTGGDGVGHFGIGVGSLVLLINATLLGFYTFGCHCARHQIGGCSNRLSELPFWRKGGYAWVSWLNKRHMGWAWVSLVWVGFADIYVRMLCKGLWTDFRIF